MLPLFLLDQLLQLTAVGRDQAFLQVAAPELDRDVIVVGADQSVASLKVGDLHDFRLGQM